MKAGAYRKYGRYVAQRLNRLEFVIIVILNLKMKRILLLVVLFLFATSCFAQSVKFSINAGLSESTFSEPFTPNGKAILVNGQTISKSFVTGYNVGGLVDFTIKRVSIQTGLVYTVIGGTNNDHFNVPGNSYPYIFSDKQTLNLNYLQVPINVLYHIPTKFGSVFVGGGPYVAYGLSGKYKSNSTTALNDVTTTTATKGDVIFGNGQQGKYDFGNGPYVKNPDYGVNAIAGISLKNKIRLSAGYGFGIENLSHSIFTKGRNDVLSISIGYTFD
jgi:hypothetical protein